ncbi:MAG: flagellar protein FlaG [Sphingobacteriia bacterium]|nr:flagellar protein FlaG [Sphingobacteriia bacterium]NCC41773.1 flagellar protein FlaG [Gammaproteobacteria bacterium]
MRQSARPPADAAQPSPGTARMAAQGLVTQSPGQAQAAHTQQDLIQAVEEIQSAIEPMARNLQFSVDQDLGRTVVRVVDTSTEEVIRQIPPEEVLAFAKAVDKLKGLLIHNTA